MVVFHHVLQGLVEGWQVSRGIGQKFGTIF